MSTTKLSIRAIAMACALCAAVPAMAQSNKGQQQSMATLKKEINAAYAQQKTECGRQPKAERASCMSQARQTYQSDMKNAPQLVADAPTGGIQERTISTVDSGGATAVGSSQGGATASSGDAEKGMEAGAAATGNAGSAATGSSGSGITASGTASEANATAAGDAAVGGTEPAKGMEPQPMQAPAIANPPRSEDTPIQR
jgi:hypothetical protein